MNQPQYNQTYLSRNELEARIAEKLSVIEINRVISAYELAENVHEKQIRNDGTPYFYHCTRVCKILLDELMIDDGDVLCAALLHDVLEDSKEINSVVLEYNFGAYTTYIVETLTKDLERHKNEPDAVDLVHAEKLRYSSEDCLLIRLVARLDNFRCLQFDLKRNPLYYIQLTSERYLPLAENSINPALIYVVSELKKERNKFLG